MRGGLGRDDHGWQATLFRRFVLASGAGLEAQAHEQGLAPPPGSSRFALLIEHAGAEPQAVEASHAG
jgi:hypothetical protein